jgi:alkaline phosphatase
MENASVAVGAGLTLKCGVIAQGQDDSKEAKKATIPPNAKRRSIKIGLITDLHYADKETAGTRYYRESTAKLTECVKLFHEEKPDFVVELGDLVDAAPTVDEELGFLKSINGILRKMDRPCHYVLGNHCVATLTKEEFLKEVQQPKSYYSFDLHGFHFVILDACFNREMQSYGRNNFEWTDTNIPPAEVEWLEKDLTQTQNPVIVFAHQRLDLNPQESYAVKQCRKVRKLFEASGKVLAVFQGHSHKNELHLINEIPYCTLAAIIEGSGSENNAYGILELSPTGTIQLKGYRKQENYNWS